MSPMLCMAHNHSFYIIKSLKTRTVCRIYTYNKTKLFFLLSCIGYTFNIDTENYPAWSTACVGTGSKKYIKMPAVLRQYLETNSVPVFVSTTEAEYNVRIFI
jgi:hypothetical protein